MAGNLAGAMGAKAWGALAADQRIRLHHHRTTRLLGMTPTEDEDEQIGGVARRRDRNRTKESDQIKLLRFPSGTAWRAWRANAIHAIISAAGRLDDSAQDWIMEVETVDATIDL